MGRRAEMAAAGLEPFLVSLLLLALAPSAFSCLPPPPLAPPPATPPVSPPPSNSTTTPPASPPTTPAPPPSNSTTNPPASPPTTPAPPPSNSTTNPPASPPTTPAPPPSNSTTYSPASPPTTPAPPPSNSTTNPPASPPTTPAPPPSNATIPPALPPTAPPPRSNITSPPAAPPVPSPSAKVYHVAVEGVVYCKQCVLAHYNPSLGASPLSGAVVKLQCKLAGAKKLYEVTAKTDFNGYFYLEASPKVSSLTVKKCKLYLVSSPVPFCAKPSDYNGGAKGAKLKFQRRTTPNGRSVYYLYTTGMLYFGPSSSKVCPKLPKFPPFSPPK